MKWLYFMMVVSLGWIGARGASADVPLSLNEAVYKAIQTNPDIVSARKSVELAAENIDLARSDYRPNVSANAGITHAQSDNDVQGEWKGNTSKSIGVSLTQPLYRGGRTTANIQEQKSLMSASEMNFSTAVHDKITETVAAYMDVFEARESVKVNQNNKTRLEERYRATKAGFDVGELTKTDISQAEARVAEAEADYIAARAVLDVALSNFRKVTSIVDEVNLSYPDLNKDMVPQNLDEALSVAEAQNPTLRAAHLQLRAQDFNTDEQEGAFLPEVNLDAGFDATRNPVGGQFDREESASVSLNATLPFYQSGVLRNQLRQAQLGRAQAKADLDTIRRDVIDRVIAAWENYQAVGAQIDARQAQLNAANVAQEGVSLEQTVGARSILDVLDANQDVKDAELALIEVKSDAVIYYYELLAAMGRLKVFTF